MIRLIYKVITYGILLLRSKLSTLAFRITLRINGVIYGKGVKTFKSCPIIVINKRSRKVEFGQGVLFNNFAALSWYCRCKIIVRENAELIIGDFSGMNGTLVYVSEKITIGKYVNIGGGTRIFDTDFHNLDYSQRRNPTTNLIAKTKPVTIEDDVFIGTNCIIGKGIIIGARSIVAAGSVVTKSIPPDEIWGGNPAKFLKKINN